MNDPAVLILAAGKGTRMRSSRAKALHPVGGVPMLECVVRSVRKLGGGVHVVVGHQADAVRKSVRDVSFIDQGELLGTGHAVAAARDALAGAPGPILVLPGDVPLIRHETLAAFCAFHRGGGFQGSVLTAEPDDPDGYGRVVRGPDHAVDRIVEHRDAGPDILRVREVNSGIFAFEPAALFDALARVRDDNAQGEYYLTDVVGVLTGGGRRFGAFRIEDAAEAAGVNSRAELAAADGALRRRKCAALMAAGVAVMDPETARIDLDAAIGPESVIHPWVTIEGASALGEGVTVRSHSRVTGSRIGNFSVVLDGSVVADSTIGADVRVGPRAHLRDGTVLEDHVRVGNYVEIKKSRLGEGTKAMHLAYIGDATIGKNVNVGAGVITCNYDGKRKHPTVIGDGVFVGSDTQLIAPVTIGDGAYIGAGSTINEDVPPGALAIGRSRQVVKADWTDRNTGS